MRKIISKTVKWVIFVALCLVGFIAFIQDIKCYFSHF